MPGVSIVPFFPPRDSIRIDTNDARVFALADRLWERAPVSPAAAPPIVIRVGVRPGRGPQPSAERDIVWTHADEAYTIALSDILDVRIRFREAAIDAFATEGFLTETPALAARTLLEAPAAVLLSRRAFNVLHAAAVVGRRGALVIRGASGAGKSTLTAAAWKAGFDILADESLLVAREDHDELAACVRDLTLVPDAIQLLSIDDAEAAFSGGEEKQRIDLFRCSSPASRRARRRATLLLGERAPGPARLSALSDAEFRDVFRRGSIPEERICGNPDLICESWSQRDSFRLDGAIDLPGAIGILKLLLD